MQPFLEALPVVATSAYALVGFLVIVVAWLLIGLRVRRNKHLIDALEKLPPAQRLEALQAEMGHVTPPKGLTAQQWLHLQTRRLYLTSGVIAVCVAAIALLAAYAVSLGRNEPSPEPLPRRDDPPPPHTSANGRDAKLPPPSTAGVATESPIPARPASVVDPPFVCPPSRSTVLVDARGHPNDFGGVNFDEGSCKLQFTDKEYLTKVAGILRVYSDIKITVAGYTASHEQQTDAADQVLSLCRAKEVVDYLHTKGVDWEQVRDVGHGENNPIAPNDTQEGRCSNRRVEFQIDPIEPDAIF